MEYESDVMSTTDSYRNANSSHRNAEDEQEMEEIIYIFCPGSEKGIKFWNRSPKGILTRLTGSLPYGVFEADDIQTATWDSQVNGKAPLTDENKEVATFREHNRVIKKVNRLVVGGAHETVNVIARTIIVNHDIMLALLQQIEDKTMLSEQGFVILDLNKKPLEINEIQESVESDRKIYSDNIKSFADETNAYDMDDGPNNKLR